MTKRTTYSPATNDDRAEGAAPAQEPKDPRGVRQALTMPPVGRPPIGPAGETGVLPALNVPPESVQYDERQDASRTTAETRGVPGTDPDHQPLALIVEDATELAELLQITLERIHVHSVIESHGQGAVARCRALQPDIVLLDIGLPDMTGWRVLEGIKESAADTGKMPIIIVLTAYGDAANRLVGKFQNVHSYLVKPFTPEDIKRTVREALSGRVG